MRERLAVTMDARKLIQFHKLTYRNAYKTNNSVR